MTSNTIIDSLERQCNVPIDRVSLPEGYVHYPLGDDDMHELLEDLMVYGELSKADATHTLGFTATAAWANCNSYWTILGVVQSDWVKEWGDNNLSSERSRKAYASGVKEAEGVADV